MEPSEEAPDPIPGNVFVSLLKYTLSKVSETIPTTLPNTFPTVLEAVLVRFVEAKL